MHKTHFAVIRRSTDPLDRSRARKRNILLFAVTFSALAWAASPSFCAENSNQSGKEKIAEMTALVRHSEACPPVPREWSIAYLMLLMIALPTEAKVVELEHKMLALRREIGTVQWCQLYSVEMEQAYLIIKMAKPR